MQVVPGAAHVGPARGHHTRGGIQVVPGAVHIDPARRLGPRGLVVEPPAAVKHPSGHHVATRIKTIRSPTNLNRGRGRVGSVLVAIPPADRVLDPRARLGLVNLIHAGRHRIERVEEAVASVLPTVDRRVKASVIGRGLLLHEVDNLRAGQLGVHRLDEGRNARHVRGRHGRAVGNGVTARVEQQGNRGVNLVARSGKINRIAVVGKLGATQGQSRLHVVRLTDRAHLGDTVEHGGNADTPLRRAILRRRGNVGRRSVVNRRIVDIDTLVAGRRDDRQALVLRVLNRPRGRLEARSLLRVSRAPIDPRVHRVGVIHDIYPVARRPHERTRHVLGIDEAVVVGRLNGDDGGLGGDAVDTNVIVVGGDNAGDVRAVVELVAPPVEVLRRNAIHRALHGTRRIDAPLQVGMRVLNAGVNNRDGHRGALDVDCLSLARMHGDGAPVEDLLVRPGGSGTRGLIAHGVQAARRAELRGLVLLVRGQLDPLVVEDGGHAGRADRVDGDAGRSQGGGQVGRERGRGTLREEGPDLRVRGQGGTTGSGDEGEGPLEVLGVRAREVDRVVHLVGVGAGGRDEAGLLGSGGRCVHRGHAHGQGESGDDADACGSAAHGSSTFDCHCQDFGCMYSCAHHPRVCQ